MTMRNLLHKSKLDELKEWLTEHKYEWYDSPNDWQMIGILHHDKGRWDFIYDNIKADHFTVPWPLVSLITKFINGETPNGD